MKTTQVLSAAALCAVAAAKEKAPDAQVAAEMYDNGMMHMKIMEHKESFWAKRRAQGLLTAANYKSMDPSVDVVKCEDGLAKMYPGEADYEFKCSGYDLYDFQTHADLGSSSGEGAGSWGWTSPDGREFVAVAQEDGTSFSEVSKEGKLLYIARLPQTQGALPSLWREIKGYNEYIVIGSEAYRHGIQIFDMSKLVDLDPEDEPKVFTEDEIYFWNELPSGRSHNVVTNPEMDYAVAVGSQPRNSTCASGLIFIDLTDLENLSSPGCAAMDGYVHDAQCLVYRGPDEKYAGADICYGYNEDTLTIYDVTDKTDVTVISRTSYEGATYTHQGWVLDTEWQQYLVLDDEYDEYDAVGPAADGYPVTYIWDISSLEEPKQTGLYKATRTGIDHNQFIHDGKAFQSNYGGGLVVLDISSIPEDPTGAGVSELGYFDIYPEDDEVEGGGEIEFVGTWSHYPYFPSGFVVINTIERGAYVVKKSE